MGMFKKTQKSHNTGRHRSKRAIKHATEGKINVKTLTKRLKTISDKEVRRNQARQIRQKKRDEAIAKKRNFGGEFSPPILVAVIPLNEDLDAESIVALFAKEDDSSNIVVKKSSRGITHISVPSMKKRFSFIVPPVGNILETLDVIKISTRVLFVVTDEIDDWGHDILKTSIPQKLPTTMVVFSNSINSNTVNSKRKNKKIKQKMEEAINKYLPSTQIRTLNNSIDATNLLRIMSSQSQTPVYYRDKRPHLIAEHVEYISEDNKSGTMKVTGYLRGMPLSVNGLIHIIGFGDYQMSQIDAPTDPFPIDVHKEMDTEGVKVLEKADPQKQETLDDENIPDPMDCEQTWPTAEELDEAKKDSSKKIVKRVPKGTSEYQAAWIVFEDSDGESTVEDSDNEKDDEQMAVEQSDSEKNSSDQENDNEEEEEEEEYEEVTVSEAPLDEHRYDEQMDLMEERQAMEILKKAKLDAQFPDEVDTPQDTLAKIRFQKYRGLDSFRTSSWDTKENLPYDYSRIFQFENFERTRKRLMRETEESCGVEVGWYITIHVKNVDKDLFDAFSTMDHRPQIIFGLFPYEHKMSVLNVILQRTNDENAEPIASKEKLLFQCGFRRFTASPIFSQYGAGSKHKYLRFFQPKDATVATMFAPMTFPPCPILCYKEHKNGSLELIATGSVLSVDPDRLVIKRVVLSGHPFKVYKRSAVIRFMFFNREDIEWFKPVELHTKYGKRGHIKEPLGTHGHMKCVFKGQLKSQDTVLMNLYKRVFPKWTYEPLLFVRDDEEQ